MYYIYNVYSVYSVYYVYNIYLDDLHLELWIVGGLVTQRIGELVLNLWSNYVILWGLCYPIWRNILKTHQYTANVDPSMRVSEELETLTKHHLILSEVRNTGFGFDTVWKIAATVLIILNQTPWVFSCSPPSHCSFPAAATFLKFVHS